MSVPQPGSIGSTDGHLSVLRFLFGLLPKFRHGVFSHGCRLLLVSVDHCLLFRTKSLVFCWLRRIVRFLLLSRRSRIAASDGTRKARHTRLVDSLDHLNSSYCFSPFSFLTQISSGGSFRLFQLVFGKAAPLIAVMPEVLSASGASLFFTLYQSQHASLCTSGYTHRSSNRQRRKQ